VAPAVLRHRRVPAADHRWTYPYRPGAADSRDRDIGSRRCRTVRAAGSRCPGRGEGDAEGGHRQAQQQRQPRTKTSLTSSTSFCSHARTLPRSGGKSGSWPGSVDYRAVVDSGVTRCLACPVHF
jgi:hypothetical protein